MKFLRHAKIRLAALAFLTLLLLAGCGGGGGLLADGGIIGTGSIIGTVPGTVIEAYGDNGDYKQTFSELNNSDKHPFSLHLDAGIGYYLVMIINEGTGNEIIIPIAFPGNKQGEVFARIVLREGQEIDLGHIALYTDCANVPFESDPDDDCILDKPFILNEAEGSNNPLRQMDADDDGTDDYDDDDHGYGQQNGQQFRDPQDHDDDRVPNKYDDDFSPGSNDEDEDGIDDDEDKNPGNLPDDADEYTLLEWNGQGMHPVGAAWQEHHGEYAEQDIQSCASCHGNDFGGSSLSGQVGCYDCHNGPDPENYPGSGSSSNGGYTWQEWNGQGMHPSGQAWLELHGEYAEQDIQSCASCHGDDFGGSSLSAHAGCYDCHDGPVPEID